MTTDSSGARDDGGAGGAAGAGAAAGARAGRRAYEAHGAEIKAFYLLLGRHDAVVVSEAPNDETAAKLALTLGMMGYVRSETMRAFTEAEYRDIVADMP